MTRDKRIVILLVALGVVVLAGLGYYLYSEMKGEPEELLEARKDTPGETAPSEQRQAVPEVEKETLDSLFKEETNPDGTYTETYCAQIEEGLVDFFSYLDEQRYVKHLDSGKNSYNRFKKIIKVMSAEPPIPAGEGIDPRIIVRNIFFFFRILDRKDLRLIKDVVVNEQAGMEFNLNLFYRWLTLGHRCPDPEARRPSMKVIYQYAGYFLNTIGGRAYLFRRSERVRLLVTYYCLLIVNEADKLGKNDYGIDIVPFIEPLKREIGYYPKFEFQGEYIDQLNEMDDYYLQKR
ncbi:MAG: hypothetical protein ISS61_02380 [Desulfobacteraceae bacterium]|nr:hypothetical protein [Desulfobacteraceae bacterium]